MNDILSNIPEPVSVSELSQKLKRTIEQSYDFVRVRGELSKVKIYASGHLYTDLKDDNSVINAVCWKGVLNTLSIRPEEGMEVICTGKITTYPARSNYQLVIESMELAGQGALLKMLEDRRKKLEAEGLFSAAIKKQLPFIPKSIGLITSPSGAVIHDILHRLSDRFPLPVLLWPATVQGVNTVREVVAGIEAFNGLPENERPDIIIIARGGGSLEDLMPFNEEAIVRAVAASQIPIISAVGHETDTTLCDYAADRRAPTPTAAAEMAVPVRNDLIHTIGMQQQRLHKVISNTLDHHLKDIRHLQKSLGDPMQILNPQYQKLDFIDVRAQKALQRLTGNLAQRFIKTSGSLRHPQMQISHAIDKLQNVSVRLLPAFKRRTDKFEQQLKNSGSLLESFSFKKTLERGFALVTGQDGSIIRNAAQAKTQNKLKLQFADSEILAIPDKS
jgi:exodeoxyribonuclease VII large subunit